MTLHSSTHISQLPSSSSLRILGSHTAYSKLLAAKCTHSRVLSQSWGATSCIDLYCSRAVIAFKAVVYPQLSLFGCLPAIINFIFSNIPNLRCPQN